MKDNKITLKGIVATVLIAVLTTLAAGKSLPWWWPKAQEKYFEIFGSSPATAGWYGYKDVPYANESNDKKLKANCKVKFTRIKYEGGVDFKQLCESMGLKCKRVCDWEGNIKRCTSAPYPHPDGSRIGLCG